MTTAEQIWSDGTVDDNHVQTLQPLTWIEKHDVRRGGQAPIPLDLVEMGLPRGLTGLVTAVLPCPRLESGRGRLVLTTINHLNPDVVELTLVTPDGELETLRPTAHHKFYSVTRGEWLDATALYDGEHLDGTRGIVTVADIRQLPGQQRVYNMTVQGHHFYRVGDSGVLVPNSHCFEGDAPNAPTGPSSATRVVATPETKAARPVKPEDVVDKWDEYFGPGPHSTRHPRTGAVDPDRSVSADGKRSIRYGSHEMDSKPTKHHYHEETWSYDPATDTMTVDSQLVRAPYPKPRTK